MMAEEKEVLLITASCLFQGVLQDNSLVQFFRIMKASTEQQQFARLINFFLSLKQCKENRNHLVLQWKRDQAFFEEMHTKASIQVLWKEFFCISKDTFTALCNLLRPRLEKQLTQLRLLVPVKKRIAIGIRCLAKGDSFSSLSLQFGVGTSTCHSICVCTTRNEYIKFSQNQHQIQKHITNFEETIQRPQIVGAVDGLHIPILVPGENREDYFNRKHACIVNFVGEVDIKMLFLHASVGYPSSIHDSRVLQLLDIYQKIERENLLSAPLREISRFLIKPQTILDGSFPH